MDWELVKPWVNRVGIALEFLSFWFAAPEILGKRRLRAMERKVERVIRALPLALLMLFFWTAMVVLTVWFGILWGWRMLLVALAVVLAIGAVLKIMLRQALLDLVLLEWELVMMVGVFWKLIVESPWSSVTLLLLLVFMMATGGMMLVHIYGPKVVQPLLRLLADDARIRQRSLAVGAVLFVVGFLLQLIATF